LRSRTGREALGSYGSFYWSFMQAAYSIAQPPFDSGFIKQVTQAAGSGHVLIGHDDPQPPIVVDFEHVLRASSAVVDAPEHGETWQLFVPATSPASAAAHLSQAPPLLVELLPLVPVELLLEVPPLLVLDVVVPLLLVEGVVPLLLVAVPVVEVLPLLPAEVLPVLADVVPPVPVVLPPEPPHALTATRNDPTSLRLTRMQATSRGRTLSAGMAARNRPPGPRVVAPHRRRRFEPPPREPRGVGRDVRRSGRAHRNASQISPRQRFRSLSRRVGRFPSRAPPRAGRPCTARGCSAVARSERRARRPGFAR
jgi:hypothetical protein